MHNVDEILKSDALGRVRTTPQRREALVDEFFRSGVPASKFAAMVGVNYQTFATWVQRRRRSMSAGDKEVPSKDAISEVFPSAWSLVEAVTGEDDGAPRHEARRLCVHLPGEVRLELDDASHVELAVQLIKTLNRVC